MPGTRTMRCLSHPLRIFACTTMLVLAGCAGKVPRGETQPLSHLAYPTTATLPLVATRAGLSADRRLTISYQDGGREISLSTQLDEGPAPGEPLPPVLWFAPHAPSHTDADATVTPIPVRTAEEWHKLVRQLQQEVAAQVPGQGVVLDVLRQNELFLYVDEAGELQAVPLEQKPPAVIPQRTVTLTELLEAAAHRVRDSLRAANGQQHYLLFNTGDIPDTGYPFVFMDLQDERVWFIQRWGEDDPLLIGRGAGGAAQAAFHTLGSQAKSVATRPLSTFARLLTSFTSTVVDTLRPTPTWANPPSPLPPLRPAQFMDTATWEQELDELLGPGTFGQIRYLVDGAEFFPELLHAIKTAQTSIRMRMYIFDNDDYALKYADLLKARSADIPVQILLDGLGTISGAVAEAEYTPRHTPPGPFSIAAYLRTDSEVRVRMLPNPWMQGDHSKVIIIDDKSAFLGGMNIGREYRYEWHDLMVETRGPVVDMLIRDFENTQARSGPLGDLQATLQRSDHVERPPGEDDYPLRLVYTKTGRSQILRSQITAMRRAQNRIWIQNAYITSDAVLYELLKARRRGVDVRVIMPYRTDSGLISRSNALAANVMLRNGIRVYIYPGMSHLKAAIYDGWACLGSANFDRLSLRLNKETNIATSHPEAVRELAERVFAKDFAHAVELKKPLPAGWLDYLKEQIADHL